MSADYAIDLIRRAVMLTLVVSGPMLLTALVVGLFITLPWIITRFVEFLIGTLNNLSVLVT